MSNKLEFRKAAVGHRTKSCNKSGTGRGARAPLTEKTIEDTEKTREDYEEDYKCAHLGLIAEFVRDAAGM